ncbi:hypothetical protein OAB57_03180 [Bacteriovoracaceae bacterium]|nr:hypothetical protein [Bacteriovoracaceae bacterium]
MPIIEKSTYLDLIDIQTSFEYISRSNNIIQEEQRRIEFVEKNLSLKNQEFINNENFLQSQSNHDDLSLEKIIKRIEFLVDKGNSVKNCNELEKYDTELTNLKEKRGLLEDQIFQNLCKVDEILSEQEILVEFLKGAKSSLNTIKNDANSTIGDEHKKIEHYKNRIRKLISESPKNVQLTIKRTVNLLKKAPIICFIDNNSCDKCFLQLPSKKHQEVEDQTHLRLCSSCQRIFLPNSLKESSL